MNNCDQVEEDCDPLQRPSEIRRLKEKYLEQARKASNSEMYKGALRLIDVRSFNKDTRSL